MMRLILSWKFWKDTRGQDLIEYALIAGFIALAAVATLGYVGDAINALFDNVNSQLTSAVPSGS